MSPGLGLVAGLLLAAAGPPAPPAISAASPRPAAPAAIQAASPGAAPPASPAGSAFVDRAAEWGLSFRYETGAGGQFHYPEIMGGGAALFDYDGDGDLDAFLVQGRPLEPGRAADPARFRGGRLFRNELVSGGKRRATPRFVDVTAESGIRAGGYGMGVATGDYDNDGRVDLLVLAFGPDQLWRNRGDGTFEDVSARAGIADPRMSVAASFADLDRDGWLDLYVVEYVDFAVERSPRCYAPSSRRDYCGPTAYPPVPDRLLRNRRDGTFEDVSLPSGVGRQAGRGMGVVAADLDGDGWSDLFVANDGGPNFLWRNRRDGTFEEVGLLSGAAVDAEGRALANMGVAAGDPDGDGDLDLFVTHLAGEANTLWVNGGAGLFQDRTARAGLGAPSLPATGFGTGWLDYDGDGRLDLFAANGAVSLLEEQAQRGAAFPYAQPRQMFRNIGGNESGGSLRFADVSREMGPDFLVPEVGRGAALGDVDEDGDTDLLVVNAEGPARLLVNQVGNRNPWLGLRLMGRPAGAREARDLPGARAEILRQGAPPLWRRAATDGSYASASDPRVLVGLGEAPPPITEVRVHWHDGKVETFPPPPLGAYFTLIQGTGKRAAIPPETFRSRPGGAVRAFPPPTRSGKEVSFFSAAIVEAGSSSNSRSEVGCIPPPSRRRHSEVCTPPRPSHFTEGLHRTRNGEWLARRVAELDRAVTARGIAMMNRLVLRA